MPKVYLKNKNSINESLIKKAITECNPTYVFHTNHADYVIDCSNVRPDNVHLFKCGWIKEINNLKNERKTI